MIFSSLFELSTVKDKKKDNGIPTLKERIKTLNNLLWNLNEDDVNWYFQGWIQGRAQRTSAQGPHKSDVKLIHPRLFIVQNQEFIIFFVFYIIYRIV